MNLKVGFECVRIKYTTWSRYIEDAKKPKWTFKHAERSGAKRVVLIGEKEWEQGLVRVKDMETREEVDVKPEDLR